MTSSVLAARARFRAPIVPAPRADWNAVAMSDPAALATQLPGWTDACCEDGRWRDVSRLYVTADDRRVVVPMVRHRAPGGFESSMPAHWGFGGLLAEGGVRPGDIEQVLTDLRTRSVVRQALRPNPLHGQWWSEAGRGARLLARRAHVLDLAGGLDNVWKRMTQQGRRAIRASDKHGVAVEVDTTGRLLPTFFELFERSRARWTAQSHEPAWLARKRNDRMDSLGKWQRIARHLGPACAVWLARLDGEPVAATIVLSAPNTAHHTRSAMDKERSGSTYASEAVVWASIQAAAETGRRWFHMGESGDSAQLARYKEKFACRAYPYPEMRVERLPLTPVDQVARRIVKRVIGFRDGE